MRYRVESGYRNDESGDWVGVMGCVDGVSRWYCVVDTDHDAADWDDDVIGASESLEEVKATCERLNTKE